MKTLQALIGAALITSFSVASFAAVSPNEAEKLKTTLMPLGGERAGNAEGTIPPWTGGATKKIPGKHLGDVPLEIFKDEKPILSIDSTNMDKYADKLTPGTKRMMEKYPSTFRIDVYPTHRTAAAPEWVYESTFRNATECSLTNKSGPAIKGCYGGTPFPIPQNGLEVIWNWILRLEPESIDIGFKIIIGTKGGKRALSSRNDESFQFPYYFEGGSAKKWNGEHFMVRFNTTEPPFKVGESLVFRDSIDSRFPRQAWQYLVGQRRVRRAPTASHDTPDFVSAGGSYFDEVRGYQAFPDRYDFKIIGKKEMYIPYNTNGSLAVSVDEAFIGEHMNPDHMRWELHRVWEIEGTVAAGKRHAVPKRRFYFDEDTWMLALMDGYDSKGKLWRTSLINSFIIPKLPGTVMMPVTIYDFDADTMSLVQMLNEEYYNIVPRKPEIHFTGDAMAADAAR